MNDKTTNITIRELMDIIFDICPYKIENKRPGYYVPFKFNHNVETNNIEDSFADWNKYYTEWSKYLNNSFYFLNIFMAGYFNIPTGIDNTAGKVYDLSRFIKSGDKFNIEKEQFRNLIKDDTYLYKTTDGKSICRGALIVRIIYDIQTNAFEKLNFIDISKKEELYNSLINLLAEHGYDDNIITGVNNDNIISDNFYPNNKDHVKLFLLCMMLALGINYYDAYSMLFKNDARNMLCFNPVIDIHTGFGHPVFFSKLANKTGILGTAGSLELLRIGEEYFKSRKEAYNEDSISSKIDALTLLTLADVYYYESVATVSDRLIKAYICSLDALGRNYPVAAYNLAHYHYMLATDENISTEYKLLESYMKINGKDAHLSKAMNYLLIAGKANHPSSYNTLGNIAAREAKAKTNGTMFLTAELAEKMKSYVKEINNSLGDKKYKGNDDMYRNFNEISFIFYKKSAYSGCLDGMYNYIRSIEVKLINSQENALASKNHYIDELKYFLVRLKDSMHPKGTNVYLQYLLYENRSRFVNNLPDNFFEDNADIVPRLHKIENEITLGFDDNKTITFNSIIDSFKTVSSFKFDQLVYFWPVYHYCLLKFQNITRVSELTEIRDLLNKIRNDNILRKEPDYKSDLKNAYLLLLKIANYQDSDKHIELTSTDKSYTYALIKDKVEEIIKIPDDAASMTEREIKKEFDALKKWYTLNSSADIQSLSTTISIIVKKLENIDKRLGKLE